MGWAAGFFGAGSAVVVVGCFLGMGLLIWLLFRLTSGSSPPVGVQPPHAVPDRVTAEERIEADVRARRAVKQGSTGLAAGSGSVAP